MRRALLALPLLALTTASAMAGPDRKAERDAREAARLATALEGRTPGKPLTCIRSLQSYGVESYGNSTLLFRINRNLVYRNDARGQCGGLGNGRALVTRSFTGELCRGDSAQTVDSAAGFPSGLCFLGEFVPYRKN